MDKDVFVKTVSKYYLENELNYIGHDKALSAELIGVKMYEDPIVAMAAADDPGFDELKKEGVVGAHLLLPKEWLASAQTVVLFFFPMTEEIRNTNKKDMTYPSKGWLNARIEGQVFISNYTKNLVNYLNEKGFKTIAPAFDERFASNTGVAKSYFSTLFTSNWSERHAAYVCGLGTFSLSKGMITQKGMAGRFTSIITELKMQPDGKHFVRYDENCIMCGKCVKNCPVGAITLEKGKDHQICSDFLDDVYEKNKPWYGCGKCQINVPCEAKNPR